MALVIDVKPSELRAFWAFPTYLFTNERDDHPGRRGCPRRRQHGGKPVSGNSKWHRRMVKAGYNSDWTPRTKEPETAAA